MADKPKVIVYSTDACPWCHKAKDFLKEKGIEFEDVNVGTDQARAQEMVEKSGQTGVPVIIVGDKVMVGFNKPELMKLLDIKE
ncbi:glutaredoxin family protein [Candidatus Pacearchaeota archaeon]|nr:glutaredoxin family protein [Candidatus Pacearchaeota archaeon]